MTIDIARRHSIEICGTVTYEKQSLKWRLLDWAFSNEEKIKCIFNECIEAMGRHPHAAIRILNFTTQASLAEQWGMIKLKFENLRLENSKHLACLSQRVVVIEEPWGKIVRVFYHSLWGIVNINTPEAGPVRYMGASLEFVLDSKCIENGELDNSIAYERFSPFFERRKDAERYGEWPSHLKKAKHYDQRMRVFPNYYERLHRRSYLDPLKEKELVNVTTFSSEIIHTALKHKNFPLTKITVNGCTLFPQEGINGDKIDYDLNNFHESKLNENSSFHFLWHLCSKMQLFLFKKTLLELQKPSLPLKRLCLLFGSVLRWQLIDNSLRYLQALELKRLLLGSGYEVKIDKKDSTDKIMLTLTSCLKIRDSSSQFLLNSLNVKICAHIHEEELFKEDYLKNTEVLLYITKGIIA